MNTHHDIIIGGGGPAGSTAALVLARQGLDVLLVDKATFPRKKLCGGLLTWKSTQLLKTVFDETPDSLIRAGVINYASDRYRIRTYDRTLAQGDLPFPFHFTDRALFDAHLLDHARRAGAVVVEGHDVAACDPDGPSITLGNGQIITARYLIGADGANSLIRRSFPHYNRERFKQFMAPAIEIALQPDDFPTPVTYPELIVGFLDAGYGWVFPNQDRVIVGICGLRPDGVNFSDLFRSYLEHLGVDPAIAGPFHGHPLPYGNYLENPVHGNTLLAGDAAGLVEPLFGEGIFFALCSGLYAGAAVAEGLEKRTHPGPIYSSRLHRQIMPELKASDRLRWTLFRAVKHIGPFSLGVFVNSAASRLAEMVHGMRSYSWLRKKRWDFL